MIILRTGIPYITLQKTLIKQSNSKLYLESMESIVKKPRKKELNLKSNKLKEGLMKIAEKFYKTRGDIHFERNQYMPMRKDSLSRNFFLTHLSVSSTMFHGIHPPHYSTHFFGFSDKLSQKGFATQKTKVKDTGLSKEGEKSKLQSSGEGDERSLNNEKWDKFVSSVVGNNPEDHINEERKTYSEVKETTDMRNTIEHYDLNESDMQDFRLDVDPETEGSVDTQDKGTSTLGSVKVIPKSEELIRRKQLLKSTKADGPQRSIIVSMSNNPEMKDNQEIQDLDRRVPSRKSLSNFFANKPMLEPANDINYPGDNLELKLTDEFLKKYQSPIGKNSFLEEKLKEAMCFDSNFPEKAACDEEVKSHLSPKEESEVKGKTKEKTSCTDDSLVFDLEPEIVEVGKDKKEVETTRKPLVKSGASGKQETVKHPENPKQPQETISSKFQLDESQTSNELLKSVKSLTKLESPPVVCEEDLSETKQVVDNNLKKGLRKVLAFCQTLQKNYDLKKGTEVSMLNDNAKKDSGEELEELEFKREVAKSAGDFLKEKLHAPEFKKPSSKLESKTSWNMIKEEPRNHSLNSLDQDKVRVPDLVQRSTVLEDALPEGSNIEKSVAKDDLKSTKVDIGLLEAAKTLMQCSEPQLRSAIHELMRSYEKDVTMKSSPSQTLTSSDKRKGIIKRPSFPLYHKTSSKLSTVSKKDDTLVLNITIKIPIDTVNSVNEKGSLKTDSFVRKKWIREDE